MIAMPRNDAKRWRRKVERIIKSSLDKEESRKKEFSQEYHDKVLQKIQRGKEKKEKEE